MTIAFDGAVAVITGAGSGIGRATARSLARRGARVVVADIDGDRAATVAGELGAAGVALRCDVTSNGDLEAARDLALSRFGRVDLVMNNVGVLAVGPVEDIPLAAWQRIIDINLATNIVEQITFYGKPSTPRGPSYPVVDAETVGELVAAGVAEGRFLLLTAPEVTEELRRHADDVDT